MPDTIKERFWRRPTRLGVLLFFVILSLTSYLISRLDLPAGMATLTGATKHMEITMRAGANCTIYIHYIPVKETEYIPKNMVTMEVKRSEQYNVYTIGLPDQTRLKTFIISPLMTGKGTVEIKRIKLAGTFLRGSRSWEGKEIENAFITSGTEVSKDRQSYLMRIDNISNLPELRLKEMFLDNGMLMALIVIAIIPSLFLVFLIRTPLTLNFSGQRMRDIILTGIFILFISAHILNSILNIFANSATTENRTLASRPELTIKNIFNYPAEFDAYLNDNFSLRSDLVRMNHYIKVAFLKTSPVPKEVIIGRDGWLFYGHSWEVEHYSNNNRFTKEQLNTIHSNLMGRYEWLDKQGIKYYLIIVPNKSTVYAEYMPSYIHRSSHTGLDQIIESLGPGFPVIDLRPAFAAHKNDPGYLYSKTGTHWNTKGAFVGYQAIMGRIGRDYPNLRIAQPEDLKSGKTPASPELVNMMGISAWPIEDEAAYEIKNPGFRRMEQLEKIEDLAISTSNLNLVPSEGIIVDVCEGCTQLKTLVFRDSFTSLLRPYLSNAFARTEYIWPDYLTFSRKIVTARKPDIVIEILVERGAIKLLQLDN